MPAKRATKTSAEPKAAVKKPAKAKAEPSKKAAAKKPAAPKAATKTALKAAPKAATKSAPVSEAPKRKNGAERALVVVESPAKAKTIKKYLGSGYTVKASVGHVVDLPKSKMGVDVENGFLPEY